MSSQSSHDRISPAAHSSFITRFRRVIVRRGGIPSELPSRYTKRVVGDHELVAPRRQRIAAVERERVAARSSIDRYSINPMKLDWRT